MTRGSDLETDILVVGSGIAGLTFALKAAEHGSVVLVTKKERADSNTNYARGGIAAVFGEDDSIDLHRRDTFLAGAGLCHREAVEALVGDGPDRIGELIDWGTRFIYEGASLSLGREGGHSRRRILHSKDRTGRAIESALLDAVDEASNIEVLENHRVVDLLVGNDPGSDTKRCGGATILPATQEGITSIRAKVTMLATGGCGQVYRHTTNPAIATGDGVAMAYRAGARIGNMEFVQFHPTALFPTEDPAFLISEALRGEGAILRRVDGTPLMDRHHELGSLAPRDVVAQVIDREMRRSGDSHIVLDLSAVGKDVLESRFPNTLKGCRARGIEPSNGIPVVPAAHYVCGGVFTDLHGRTSLPGLYAAGEVACTGVHGANRLASNSLLEAVVFSHRASENMVNSRQLERKAELRYPSPSAEERGAALEFSPEVDSTTAEVRKRLRELMWEKVGIARNDSQLGEAEEDLAAMEADRASYWGAGLWTDEELELRSLIQTGLLIVRCARWRRESRGLHYNPDRPFRDNESFLRDSSLVSKDSVQ